VRGKNLFRLVVTVGIALVFAAQVSLALAVDNVASTQRLVEAEYQLSREMITDLPSGLASMHALVNHVRHECPSAGAQAPPSAYSQAQQFVQEMSGSLVVTLLHDDRRSIRRIGRVVAPLQWSSRSTTNRVKSETAKLENLGRMAIPNVCLNIREWAAGHFAVVPRSTTLFDRQLAANEGDVQPSNIESIKSYKDARTKVLDRRLAVLRKRFELREGRPALRDLFALVRAIFGERCTSGKICLPFQVLTPGDLERGQINVSSR
jgi:hypothetical protein